MDDTWDATSKYGGLTGEESAGGDLIKAIKLSAYRSAIANFTKILTKKDIKVIFGGDMSYTDGQTISISTAIKDNNFDVQVGLALHEASHCILTDFNTVAQYMQGPGHNLSYDASGTIKSLTNWVEDRRIDLYVFKNCPGYKAYYHKLYDEYFNDPAIDKGFASKQYRKVDVESYMFHIINMVNPLFNPAALPGLAEIAKIIDLRSISRLQSTKDALDVAVQVWGIIQREIKKEQEEHKTPQSGGNGSAKPQEQDGQSPMPGEDSEPTADAPSMQSPQGQGEKTDEKPQDDGESEDGEGEGETGEDSGEAEDEGGTDLSPKEEADLAKAVRQQRKFVNNQFDRKHASKKLQQKLEQATKSGVEVQSVFGGKLECLTYDFTKNPSFVEGIGLQTVKNAAYSMERGTKRDEALRAAANAVDAHPLSDVLSKWFYNGSQDESTAVDEGMQLGAMLGRKLQLRNETRDLTVNRLNSGKLDAKRISHAGYGVENVFKQVFIDKHKNSVIHISLDASGSMSGTKWENAITMTMAIAKAATMCTNLRVQVSLRHTDGNGSVCIPVVLVIYDSAKRTPLSMLAQTLKAATWNSMTPEGLCFEAMWNKNMFVGASSDTDSYFLNVSDGSPGGCGGRGTDYSGNAAYKHTRKFIDKMINEKGIQILSFFVRESMPVGTQPSDAFREMYGYNNAFCVQATDMVGIARTLNSKFLSAKVTV